MINRGRLLSDLQVLLRQLEADLADRSDRLELPEVKETLREEYARAQKAERTALSYEQWRSQYATQVAVAWVLSAVFVRFLEDNGLVEVPKIAGSTLTPNPSPQGEGCQSLLPLLPGEKGAGGMRESRLQRARDEHELYFRSHPTETDREYLLQVFRELGQLPGMAAIFLNHNPVFELPNWLSGDAAGSLLRFFQKIDPATGALVHDFTDPEWDTRFLGDLYQDLSEAARKQYALLQTPIFVEEFILDRTLNPAIEEFGLQDFRMIDPACGSGHFLLGAFERILDRWQRQEPGTNVRALAQRALDAVHGVDVNPYAIAIARFRLLLAAMQASGIETLKNAPGFKFKLACGDSLLHGEGSQLVLGDWAPMAHHFQTEDIGALNEILRSGYYHAVVANPPYITPKDQSLNKLYRQRYETCHMKYSLAVPFLERIFQLAVPGGFTGQITANSFMKREFGKKLIEQFFPKVDLTHVIDTSGAYIPGHGTPTVILFGRTRTPVARVIRTVMGIRGEPSTPEDAAKGLVWSAILRQVDVEGSQSEFVSVADSQRELFHQHPWSIGGGGASELKEQLDHASACILGELIDSIGFASFTGQDEAFVADSKTLYRNGYPDQYIKGFVFGETVRDWSIETELAAFTPYDENFQPIQFDSKKIWTISIWPMRTALGSVVSFGGKTRFECGDLWWTWYRWIPEKYQTPLSIAFAFVATHNHFVLDRGGKVFNRSAPVIKLPTGATEDEHLALLGLLNSSTACFWMKQVFHDKGGGGIGGGLATEGWEHFFEYEGTKAKQFPVTSDHPTDLARTLDDLASQINNFNPNKALEEYQNSSDLSLDNILDIYKYKQDFAWCHAVSLQEELDWECYRLYNLINEDLTYNKEPPPIHLGQRAFEVVMVRKMAAGELITTWFERHNSTPITELPTDWPDDYKQLVERRIELIETDKNIGLIEQPEYKRRWNIESWDSQLRRALEGWLLNRLEGYFDFDGRMCPHPQPLSPGRGEPKTNTPTFAKILANSSAVSPGRGEPEAPLTPPSPWGEGGRGDEGISPERHWDVEFSQLAGQLRQVPEPLLQRARELRQQKTSAERILWECLRDRQLCGAKFRRQHNLGPYIADFYCHEARLVVELDGSSHQGQEQQDANRDDWMQSQGFTVLRFPNETVLQDIEQVLRQIAQVCPHPQPLSPGRGEPDLTPPSPWGEGGRGDEGFSPQGERGRGDEGQGQSCKIPEPALISTAKLADFARQDPAFLQVGELYRNDPAFEVQQLVDELVDKESVPLLPVLRYKESGLRKRQEWEHTWALQRQEDAIDARIQLPKDDPNYLDPAAAKRLKQQEIGAIPVPPKYATSDFQKTHYWSLRGKLDVPKERWVSFPHCEGPDGLPVIAWAGYNHLQLAQAISAYYVEVQERFGGSNDPRLVPLLGCLLDLLPWLKQWHNHLDPDYGLKMGDYYAGFIEEEARRLGLTLEEIREWKPPKSKGRKRR